MADLTIFLFIPLGFTLFLFILSKCQDIILKEKRERALVNWQRTRRVLSDIFKEHYQYIENFVKKSRGRLYTYRESELQMLHELLYKKGVNILFENNKKILKKFGFKSLDFETLEIIINIEKKYQEYLDFKQIIELDDPRSLDDYIRNFVDFFEEFPDRMLDYFVELLKEKEIKFGNIAKLLRLIEEEKYLRRLTRFEEDLLSSEADYFNLDEIDMMSGYEFENFLKKLFTCMGYTVEKTKMSGDQGADLIISKRGKRIVVQAKRYKGKVGNKAIQETVAAVNYYKADKGMVITNSYFTQAAVRLAKANNIELVDRDKLLKWVEEYYY